MPCVNCPKDISPQRPENKQHPHHFDITYASKSDDSFASGEFDVDVDPLRYFFPVDATPRTLRFGKRG